MNKNTTRLTAVAGATMALVIATTAAVAAHPGQRDDDRGFGPGKARMGAQRGEAMPGMRMGPGAGLRGGLPGAFDDFERRETTLQTADGVTSMRVEQGVVDSAAEDTLRFSLGSGEAVTVGIDDDTLIIAFEEQEVTRRGWNRTRLAPTEVATADIEAGTDIVVWSDAEDGADFVASRIMVQPADEAEEAEADTGEAEAEGATDETVTEDAATTDA